MTADRIASTFPRMPSPDYPYRGTFLSELAATGRQSLTIRCVPCGKERTRSIDSMMASLGDIVLPHALSIITVRCEKRGLAGNVGCAAVYADPPTVEEEERIKAGRTKTG